MSTSTVTPYSWTCFACEATNEAGEDVNRATVSAMGAEDPAAAILAVAEAMAGTARRGRGR